MKKSKINERGQALILIAFAIIGLAAIVGLAIDGAAVFSDQRHAQNAADTAALAAALAKVDTLAEAEKHPGTITTTPVVCDSGSMSGASDVCVELVLAGLGLSNTNGYDNISNNTVKIVSPPISGYYLGDEDYVQVFITSTVSTTFMRVVGRDQFTHTVQAVAFAKPGFNLADGALISSYDDNPTCPAGPGNGGGSVDVSGSSIVNLDGGGFFINSPIACGYNAPNCPDININGPPGIGINSVAVLPIDNIAQKELPSCIYPPVPENYGADPVEIPKEVDELWPNVPPECSYTTAWMNANRQPVLLGVNPIDGKDEYLVRPGFYTDFPQLGLVPNNKHIYLASGVYCIDPPMNQDLQWNSAAFLSLNASTDPAKNRYQDPSDPSFLNFNPDGVTLYIRSGGGFKFNINSPIYLDATTDPNSDYQGYLIILEGTHTSIESCEIEGGAFLDVNGMIWAPYCDITINGQSAPNSDINAQIVGWDIKITGNNTINFTYNPSYEIKIKRKVGLMK